MKIIQREAFSGPVDKCLVNLQSIVDDSGIIRVTTRIFRKKDEENFRLPIVLPSKHSMVQKLENSQHERLNHADSPETVCFPDSDVAVTTKVPVDAAIIRIPDKNGSPVVRAEGTINKQDETNLDASHLSPRMILYQPPH
ncbi:hypothetical protein TNCV_776571 [Trichonephila clavipes]|nr:hypothetical protein TNCV_776571 [Trichonephila clavipes]